MSFFLLGEGIFNDGGFKVNVNVKDGYFCLELNELDYDDIDWDWLKSGLKGDPV